MPNQPSTQLLDDPWPPILHLWSGKVPNRPEPSCSAFFLMLSSCFNVKGRQIKKKQQNRLTMACLTVRTSKNESACFISCPIVPECNTFCSAQEECFQLVGVKQTKKKKMSLSVKRKPPGQQHSSYLFSLLLNEASMEQLLEAYRHFIVAPGLPGLIESALRVRIYQAAGPILQIFPRDLKAS